MSANSIIALRQAVKTVYDGAGALTGASLTPLYLEEFPEEGVNYPASLMTAVSDTVSERSAHGEYWLHLLQLSIYAVGAVAVGEHARRVREVFQRTLPDLNPDDGEVLSMQLHSMDILRDDRDLWHAALTYQFVRRANRQHSDG